MGCTNPLQVSFYRDAEGIKRLDFGSRKTFETTRFWCERRNVSLSIDPSIQILPCGKCQSCRLARARMWALRCHLESRYHEHKYFVTFTYAPEHLPHSDKGKKTLVKKHYQDFLKRLRISIERKQKKEVCHLDSTPGKIKYFGCGEYGSLRGRPHYHLCIFGLKLTDLLFHSRSESGNICYTSEYLTNLWGKGHVIVGSLTIKSAGYVARYTMKKMYDPDLKQAFYNGRVEEFQCQSQGLGSKFFDEFYTYFYDIGSIIVDDQHYTIPRYFDKLLEKKDLTRYEKVKYERALRMYEILCADHDLPPGDKQTSYERMEAKATIQGLNAKRLVRQYENEYLKESA